MFLGIYPFHPCCPVTPIVSHSKPTMKTSPKLHNGSNVMKVIISCFYKVQTIFPICSMHSYMWHRGPGWLCHLSHRAHLSLSRTRRKSTGNCIWGVFEDQAWRVTYCFCSRCFSHKTKLEHEKPQRRERKWKCEAWAGLPHLSSSPNTQLCSIPHSHPLEIGRASSAGTVIKSCLPSILTLDPGGMNGRILVRRCIVRTYFMNLGPPESQGQTVRLSRCSC